MNKLTIIFGILLVILAFNVSAYADINYNFNVNNVVVEAYDCLDSTCDSVGPFSGSFPNGQTTTNGKLTVIYPSSLATPHGYAVFYFADSMLPMEGLATWHTYGDNNHYDADYNIYFNQKDRCHSTIDTFTVTNDLYANEPLMINVDASLDATTYSAFQETSNGVGYVPEEYKDEFYSADTIVTLTIRNSTGTVVNLQTKEFTAANGNPLYMDSSERAEFTWTPTADGTYTATVTTDVIDNQCALSEQANSAKNFTVYPARPTNECYTLLNGLATDDPYPVVNQDIKITYTKISNYADNNHIKTAIPTNVQYTIAHESGAVVYTDAKTIPANADTTNPATQSFMWTPDTAGWYDITVSGVGNSNLCSGLCNTGETISERIYIEDIQTYNLRFQIADSMTGAKIEGALVDIGIASGSTDANGEVTFTELLPNTYTYTITHPDYITVTDSFEMIDCDIDIMLTMIPNNNDDPEDPNQDPVVTITADPTTGTIPLEVTFTTSVTDDGEIVSYGWNFGDGYNSTEANTTHTYTTAGTYTATVTVTDDEGAIGTASVVITSNSINHIPIITSSPITTAEVEVEYIYDVVAYDPDGDTLTYNLTTYPAGMTIDSATGLINWIPTELQVGQNQIRVVVSDGIYSADQLFIITVTEGEDDPEEPNQAPIVSITATPTSGTAPLNVSFTSVATDDGEIVSYQWNFGDGSYSNDTNVTHIYIQPGNYGAVLTVTDNEGLTTQRGVIIRINENPEDDSRWNANGLRINRLTIDKQEIFRPGDIVRIVINFENMEDFDMDYLKISAFIPDLAVWRSLGPYNLKAGKDMTKIIEMELPTDVEPGLYDLRVALNDNEVRRAITRQITII